MNWQRRMADWVSADRARPRRSYHYSRVWGRTYNPAAKVTSRPEFGTDQQGRLQWTHREWPVRAYSFRKQGQFVQNPNWAAAEIFLPTETPQLTISPFIRRAAGVRVFGRFKSADRQLNRNFDLFATDEMAETFGHSLFQPGIVQWLINDPRIREVNLAFQTIVLWSERDDVPFTQRHGCLIVEMPGQVEDAGVAESLADTGVDLLGQLSAQLWQGQLESGRPGP